MDDALQRGRDVAVGLGEFGRILFQDRAHGVGGRVAVEGALAGEHLVEDGAEGKDVGARICRLTAHLLGRHVADRAHYGAGVGADLLRGSVAEGLAAFGASELGKAEIENLYAPVVR